jgi:hypothetical protein
LLVANGRLTSRDVSNALGHGAEESVEQGRRTRQLGANGISGEHQDVAVDGGANRGRPNPRSEARELAEQLTGSDGAEKLAVDENLATPRQQDERVRAGLAFAQDDTAGWEVVDM